MNVRDICRIVDELAPPGLAYDWDRVGLRIGSPDHKVTHVLTTLSVTSAAVDEARKKKAELIVAHHAPLWDPLKTLRTDAPETRLWLAMAQAGMSCYAAHTNLDIARGGVNDALAGRLGIVDAQPLFPTPHAGLVKLVTFVPEEHLALVRQAVCEAGAGVIGDYAFCSFSSPGTGTFLPGDKSQPYSGKRYVVNEEPERRFEVQLHEARLSAVIAALRRSHPYDEVAYDVYPMRNTDSALGLGVRGQLPKAMTFDALAEYVRKTLAIQHVRTVGKSRRNLRTAAVLGGAGSRFIRSVPDDVDVFITGDVTYHDAQFAIERRLPVIDAGHHGTEKWAPTLLAEHLRAHLKAVQVTAYVEDDPFRAMVT